MATRLRVPFLALAEMHSNGGRYLQNPRQLPQHPALRVP